MPCTVRKGVEPRVVEPALVQLGGLIGVRELPVWVVAVVGVLDLSIAAMMIVAVGYVVIMVTVVAVVVRVAIDGVTVETVVAIMTVEIGMALSAELLTVSVLRELRLESGLRHVCGDLLVQRGGAVRGLTVFLVVDRVVAVRHGLADQRDGNSFARERPTALRGLRGKLCEAHRIL